MTVRRACQQPFLQLFYASAGGLGFRAIWFGLGTGI